MAFQHPNKRPSSYFNDIWTIFDVCGRPISFQHHDITHQLEHVCQLCHFSLCYRIAIASLLFSLFTSLHMYASFTLWLHIIYIYNNNYGCCGTFVHYAILWYNARTSIHSSIHTLGIHWAVFWDTTSTPQLAVFLCCPYNLEEKKHLLNTEIPQETTRLHQTTSILHQFCQELTVLN